MKTLERALLIGLAVATIGCRQQPQNSGQQPQDKRTQMMLDSAALGKNVAVVRPKEAVRPAESISDFKELSTIMQYDIDALQRTPSKEVVYVKPGEPVRPSERRQ